MSDKEAQIRQVHDILAAIICSHDSNTIRQAETVLSQLLEQHVDVVIESLVVIMRPNESGSAVAAHSVRALAVILLTKHLPVGEQDLMSVLPESLQGTIKSELLKCLISERIPDMIRHFMHCIVAIAQVTLYKDEWPELLPFILTCANTPDRIDLKQCALSMITLLCDSCFDSVNENIEHIYGLISVCLSDSHSKTRVLALTTACKIIGDLLDSSSRKEFRKFLPQFLDILAKCLNSNDESETRSILLSLVELVSEKDETAFFLPHLDGVINAMNSITSAPQLSDHVRQFALELLVDIIVCEPTLINAPKPKSKTLLSSALGMCCQLMMTLPADNPEWGQSCLSSIDEDDIESNFESGWFALYRIAQAAKPKKLIEQAIPTLLGLLSQSDWRYRHTALTALQQLCGRVSMDKLPVRHITASLSDPHSRVRHAAIIAIASLCTSYAPKLQHNLHQIIVPDLIPALRNHSFPKIQEVTCETIITFVDECSNEVLTPHLQDLMTSLLELLFKGFAPVKKQALSAIAALAGACPDEFANYYSTVIPPIKQLLYQSQNLEQQQLRCKAIEALTYIGSSVGRDIFYEDAKELLHFYMTMHSSGQVLSSDDDAEQYMLSAMARICSVLGKEFAPCLPMVVPSLLSNIAKMPATRAIKLGDNVTADDLRRRDDDDDDNPLLKVRSSTEKILAALEDKVLACSMLASFVVELKELYFPFVKATIQVMSPFLNFPESDEIQRHAIAMMPDLMSSAVAAYKTPDALYPCNESELKEIFLQILSNILPCISRESDSTLLMSLISSLFICISHVQSDADAVMDNTVVSSVVLNLMDIVRSANKRVNDRIAHRNQMLMKKTNQARLEDDGEIDNEYKVMSLPTLARLNANDDYVAEQAVNTIASFAKSHAQLFMPVFESFFPELVIMASAENQRPETRRVPFVLFHQMLEYIGPTISQNMAALSAIVNLSCERVATDVGQGSVLERASLTLGNIAQYCSAALMTRPDLCNHMATTLANALVVNQEYLAQNAHNVDINNQDDDDEEEPDDDELVMSAQDGLDTFQNDNFSQDLMIYAVDNIVCAIGKVCCYFQRNEMLHLWLQNLPVQIDVDEGEKSYDLLCKRIEGNDMTIFGSQLVYLPSILKTFSSVIQDNVSSEELRQRMCELLCSMTQQIPSDALNSAIESLSDVDQILVSESIQKSFYFIQALEK